MYALLPACQDAEVQSSTLIWDWPLIGRNVVSPARRLCPRTNVAMREPEDIYDQKNQTATDSPGSVYASFSSSTIASSSRFEASPNFYGIPRPDRKRLPFLKQDFN
jgi:hypothetical protein